MNKRLALLAIVALASACEAPQQLSDYRPIVDPSRSNGAKFEADLASCRNIALAVEKDYQKKQADQMVAGLLVGALTGAVAGAAIGHNTGYQGELVRTGVVAGAAGGVASNDYSYDLVKYGPRRVVDRCMAQRGHTILNDPGRG